jgi:glycosyltransferase involved in cell wall biosynthesis
MKVALYYPWIYLTSGAERVLVHLTGKSRHEWTLFTNRFQPESTFPEFSHRNVVELDRVSVDRRIGPTAVAAWKIARQKLPLQGYSALVVVCEGLGDLILLRNSGIPALNICLTPLRIVFDRTYRERAVAGKGLLWRAALAAGGAMFRWVDRRAWRCYRRVFCISRESAARAAAGGLWPAERLGILHVGLGFEPDRPSMWFEPFFFVPGRIMWTKNLELAIASYQRFVRDNPEYAHFRLVIAGIVDEKSKPYLERLKQMAAHHPGIDFVVFPSDEQLQELYERCYAVLFTAFNEDWGIVPIEGLAFGKPVIAVNRGGPLESIRPGREGFLEPPQADRFAARMAELARTPGLARQMGLSGHERSKLFNWHAFTRTIDDAIDELCGATAASPESVEVQGAP